MAFARVLKPPAPLDLGSAYSVFLAGSIEMGDAPDWQSVITRALSDLDVVILNPRRDAWDAGWRQDIDDPRFRGQVEWELDAQERAMLIAMHFDPATKAPITLLELGLAARSGKLVVSCPEGFWRGGNVQVVCARHGIPLVDSLERLVAEVRARLVRSLALRADALADGRADKPCEAFWGMECEPVCKRCGWPESAHRLRHFDWRRWRMTMRRQGRQRTDWRESDAVGLGEGRKRGG